MTPKLEQLPHDVRGFADRDSALRELDALLASHETPGSGAVIAAIDGLAGVGKTSLAIHWAHRVSGHFPAGALYLDLRGHDPYQRPMPALEALGHLLDAMGVPASEVPGDLDARSRAYRSALGGGRWLVVLDNAASAAQVRPMLPGARQIFTVVTSRSFLGGLVATEGAYRLAVSPMTTAEAQDLLAMMIGPDRAAADRGATLSLITACGRLPLALRVAAAQLVGDPGRSVAGLAARLTGARRLDALRLDGDDRATVPAAFGLSYQALSPAARQAFLLLGALPARAVSVDARAGRHGDAGPVAPHHRRQPRARVPDDRPSARRHRRVLHRDGAGRGAERLIGYERGLAPVLARLASVELALGEPHHAAAHAEEALRTSHRSGDRAGEAAALMARADVGLARGEYDAARQDAQDAIRVCEEAGLSAQHARATRALHAIDTAVAS